MNVKVDTLEDLHAELMKDPEYAAEYRRMQPYYDGFSDGYDLGTFVDKDIGAKKMKTGFKTSEFYITAVVNIIAAVIAILGIRGLVTAAEGDLYVALASAVATTVAPLVMAFVSGKYIQGRSQVKAANNGYSYDVEPVSYEPAPEGE